MRFPTLHSFLCLIIAISSSFGQLIRFPTESELHQKLKVFPGKPCRALRGEGSCQEYNACPPSAKKGMAHTCGFYGEKFYVCCPEKNKDSLTLPPGVPSPLTTFRCGTRGSVQVAPGFARRRRNSRQSRNVRVQVVGGIESEVNSWPWMILLGRKETPRNKYFCSAVLINNDFALTAAHCLLDPSPLFARLGEHDHSKPPALVAVPPEDIHVQQVIIHPKYEIEKGYYDVAILKLASPVTFRNEIRPVCLPWGSIGTEDLVGERVTIAGWGSEQFGGSGSPVLREVEVSVFEPSQCQRSYSTLSQFSSVFPDGMTRQNIVCAGNTLGGKDSCQGDSGGPIVHLEEEGFYSLAGIISRGYGCGKEDFPGLYTPIRNEEILNWIKRNAF